MEPATIVQIYNPKKKVILVPRPVQLVKCSWFFGEPLSVLRRIDPTVSISDSCNSREIEK